MYNEPHLFKVHNLISFDICIHSRNHNHPQDNECTHHPKVLLRPLCNPSHQVSLLAPHPWQLRIYCCHYTLVCIFRNFTQMEWHGLCSFGGRKGSGFSHTAELFLDPSMRQHVSIVHASACWVALHCTDIPHPRLFACLPCWCFPQVLVITVKFLWTCVHKNLRVQMQW